MIEVFENVISPCVSYVCEAVGLVIFRTKKRNEEFSVSVEG